MNNWFHYKVRDEKRHRALLEFRKSFRSLIVYNEGFTLDDRVVSGGLLRYIRKLGNND